MVVSRNDIKRKRKDSDTTLDTLPESPKRTKVHAQRKFAQGSNVSSPVITPVKEIDREKVKCPDVLQTTTDLLPIKRPNTEDFLTFLCFRGTSILPPKLNFFNTSNNVDVENDSPANTDTTKKVATTTTTNDTSDNGTSQQNTERPFIAFGVRKRADPFVNNKLEKKRRHTLALQALRRKYQEQKMAKIRAVTIQKMSEGVKIKNKNLVRTRSVARREVDSNPNPKPKIARKIKVVTKRVKITRSPIKRPILKQKMCLRSRGRFIPRELSAPIKKRPVPVKKVMKPPPKRESSSEFSSDDDQPLVKAIKKPEKSSKKIFKPIVAKKLAPGPKKPNLIRLTRSSQSAEQLENSTSQRPTRKTKEAAALYMELLGRKLVNETEVDDDNTSIDSFPELPNVRRTEQRENEMKAKVKNQPDCKLIKRKAISVREKIEKSKQRLISEKNVKSAKSIKKPFKATNTKIEKVIVQDEEKKVEKEPKKILRSRTEKSVTKTEIKPEKSVTKPEIKPEKEKKCDDKPKIEQTFNDSDEEPLAKLTVQKKPAKPVKKALPGSDTKSNVAVKKKATENIAISNKKTTPQISKKEEKIVPKISLSDDEENAFRGFGKSENPKNKIKPIIPESKCLHVELPVPPAPTADLLCKDVGRRFGKEKVNMSTEQIEKWLEDSALAEEKSKKDLLEKKNEDEMLKYDEKSDNIILTTSKISNEKILPILPKPKIKPEKVDLPKPKVKVEPIKHTLETPKINKNECKYTFQQRRTILSKDRKEISPNTTAFSPDNESSVYAFEAETEMPVNTPFRSNVRRPSSTATSRSEDEASKLEDEEKRKSSDGKFRLPTVVKPMIKNQGKQEVSLTLSADEANNSASIAVQVNLDSDAGFSESGVSMECSTQTDAGDEDGHLFYIPLQPGKQTTTSQQIIQGVAVKLGTEGSGGGNQRVVMRAKLVTQPRTVPDKIPILGQQKSTSTLMYPPVGTVQPTYRLKPAPDNSRPMVNRSTLSESKSLAESTCSDSKTVPSSPSASSSSSAKIYKRAIKPRARSLDLCVPINSTEFPSVNSPAQLVEAPTFRPNEKEFQDPMEYIEKIKPYAEKFGICRIIPPANFKPECKVTDDMRFTAYNQYVHKMLHRWGPNFKELMAIKKYLATQSITFTHPPWIGGMEIDLPRLYQTVQSLGGLKEVIEKKRWPKVAEGMKIPKSAQDRVTKLDDIYCKYLLPYDTLSPAEREKLFDEVETEWAKRESRALLQSQQNSTVTSSTNESDSESGDDEAEECTVKGRNIALNAFYRIARNTMSMWFKSTEPTAQEVEQEFWKHVTTRQNHICVHSGSIDSSGWGYGFACSKNSPFARHPWNLKIFTNNSSSVLRSMGPIMGVTVPTLHVGMVFTACCWYRDPHGLPWIEYLHTGANKIWYGIPDSYSSLFHSALLKTVPSYCRNKTLWLTSDTAMVPPSLLVKNGVSLCRTVQEPGQFIVVFPKAFTSSVCSGYVVSESVYFARANWLATAQQAFKDIRDSCESSMFSFERLLLSIATDSRSNYDVLKQIFPIIEELRDKENIGRIKLESLGLKTTERLPLPESSNARRKRKLQEDDGEYECEICRTNLYVSLVIDSHEEGVYCLDHAVDHIKGKTEQLKYCKLLYTYNVQDLDNVIERMKFNIETKSQPKRPGGKYVSKNTLLKS